MMPRPSFQHRAPDDRFVSLVSVEQEEFAVPTQIHVVPADAQMIARDLRITIRPAREKVSCDRTLAVRETVPNPTFDTVHVAQLRNCGSNSPARKMRRPIASRLLIQPIALRSRQIKCNPVFVACMMNAECVGSCGA